MVQKTKEEQRSKGKTETSDFLAQLAARKKKKAGATKEKDPEPIDVDGVEAADQINSPDRDDFEQPAPPPAKKINGKYVNAEWDEDDAEWKFPEGTDKAEKAAAVAAKKAAKGKPAKQSAKDILAATGKGNKAAKVVERVEEEEVEEVEEEAEETEEISLLDELLDLLADKVVERLNRK